WGEAAFITTSADPGRKEGSGRPSWTMFSTKEFGRVYVPFLDMTLNHLLHGQADVHNIVAGVLLAWRPQEKELRTYTLIHPDGRKERLGLPETNDQHALVIANKLEKAGVYRIVAEVPGHSGLESRVESRRDPPGVPIAVTPDSREPEDLSSLNDEEIDRLLGFTPVHITAGFDGRQTGADRLD